MFRKKENRLAEKNDQSQTSLLQKTRDGYAALISFSKQVFHRFGPREKYFVGIAALIIIVSIFALAIQVYIANTSTVPAFGGEYREAVVGLPRFINPVLSSTNDVDRDMVHLIYASLMRYNLEGELIPDLAKEYAISEDGKEYRFILKDNLRWEDGTPLTAEDVIFTIGLIQNPQYSSPLFQSWQGVEVSAEDEKTIVFTLSSPYPPFLENTTLGIMPRHIWQDVSPENFVLTDLNQKPVGSGRYQVEKFTKDNSGFISQYTLNRNARYHGQKPFIDKIIFKFFSTEDEALKAYNSKSVDGISFASPLTLANIKDRGTVNIHEFKMPRYFAIFINQEKNEALQDKDVREALSLATNRKQIIEGILEGYGQQAGTPIPPNLEEYYNEGVAITQYNPGRARQLLEGAGWEDINGDGILEKRIDSEEAEENAEDENAEPVPPQTIDLSFELITADRPELRDVANLIAQQWREAGILLNIKTEELGELQQGTLRSRNYELLMFGEILGVIPDPFSFWHSSQVNDPGLNLANYENSEADELLEDARQETNKEQRIEDLMQFQAEVMTDLPAVFLYDPAYIYPVHKSIQGIEPGLIVDSSFRFIDIENWYITTKRVF